MVAAPLLACRDSLCVVGWPLNSLGDVPVLAMRALLTCAKVHACAQLMVESGGLLLGLGDAVWKRTDAVANVSRHGRCALGVPQCSLVCSRLMLARCR